MSVGVADRALPLVIKETLRLGGFIKNEGTSTAGSTTSLTDAANERTPTAQANSLAGQYLWMFSGTGVSQQAEIISYGSIGVFTWSPTLTSPATDTGWVRCSIRPQRAIDAIDEATRKARRKQAVEFLDESVMTNNLLGYPGTMEHWEDGNSVAPEGYTAGGAGVAVARESTIVAQGGYSVKVTAGGGAVGTLTRTLPTELNIVMKGQRLTLLGMMAENVAGDITARVAITNSAGTATNSDWVATLEGNRWQEIADITPTSTPIVTDPNGSVAFSTRSALSAVTYGDDFCLYGPHLYNYLLPRVAIGIAPEILMESGYRTRIFKTKLYYGADWEVTSRYYPDGTAAYREIHFFNPMPSARHLRMTLYKEPDVVTGSSGVQCNPAWLAHSAALRLCEQQRLSEENTQRIAYLREELARMERTSIGNVTHGKPVIWFEPSR